MNYSEIVNSTIRFVQEELYGAEGGHDWFHTERVWKAAQYIASYEEANVLVVELSALLHDIADPKFHNGNESIATSLAHSFLTSINVEETTIAHVISIIENVSFKGGNTQRKFTSVELDIVQDADRLDAIGAIGIARTFNYGGFKNRVLYDPAIEPKLNQSPEEYRKSNAPTINHFYEKLLLLKDRMNTKTGLKLAEKRHRFMEIFLAQFYEEWKGVY